MYVPTDPVHVRVEVPEDPRLILLLKEHESADGKVADSWMVPA